MALNIKINNQIKLLATVVSLSVVLGACSSKPSPWSQQGSPWAGNKAESVEEAVVAPDEAQPVMAEEPAVVEDVPSPWVMEPEATAAAASVDDMAQPEPMMEESAPAMVMTETAVAGNIMSQPANYFVVQVCASSSIDKLMSFARKNNLPDQWTAQTNVNGKVWHILMLGVYPTRAEADTALAFIRDKNLNTQPWIRSVGSVQAVAQ